MRLLLDTHILLWAMANDPRLQDHIKDVLNRADKLYVSVASIWEISIKTSLGKLDLPPDFYSYAERAGVISLPITSAHAQHVRYLPDHHNDPFDRMLIAQAQCEKLLMVSCDRIFTAYEVDLIS